MLRARHQHAILEQTDLPPRLGSQKGKMALGTEVETLETTQQLCDDRSKKSAAYDKRIEHFGPVQLLNTVSTSLERFNHPLFMYLQSTVNNHNDEFFVQKGGICIGSRISKRSPIGSVRLRPRGQRVAQCGQEFPPRRRFSCPSQEDYR
ncbi:hypothetical protein MTO96_040614 [Rhipicephalus appendiculatus]